MTMQSSHEVLVASPFLPFSEMRVRLEVLGWTLESQTEGPIIPDEPEWAIFAHKNATASIHYTFNPVVKLRVLQFRGSEAQTQFALALQQIPSLSATDLRALLGSKEDRNQLLGLFAAEELSEMAVLDLVEGLCEHPNDKIARTAVRVRDSLQARAITQGIDSLILEQKSHPERSALFANLSGVELRKQVLRWLMHDFETSNSNIDQMLRSAMVDADPEVRITAVIAATRLGATDVAPAIRDADIPTSTRYGADERDRFFYQKLRQTCLEFLAMKARSPVNPADGARWEQFRRAIHGELEVRDDPTLLLYSLTTPLQPRNDPAFLPDAVERCEEGFYLRRCGLVLSWVSPVAHWLGEDCARSVSPPNPIRQVIPASGFFIAQLPLSSQLAMWTSDPASNLSGTGSENAKPFLCNYGVAAHLCAMLSDLEGIQLLLPTAEQWEMAARGPDGRRYPWGNCISKEGPARSSPWDARNMAGQACEWTQDVDASGAHIVCGGEETLACARRSVAGDQSKQCAVRPVLIWLGR